MAEQFKYRLFLDDMRTPKGVPKYWPNADKIAPYSGGVWAVARSFNAFCKVIKLNGLPEFISFDHDLGPEPRKTGYDCAKWLLNYCQKQNKTLPLYAVHSMNSVGASNIFHLLSNYIYVTPKN